MREIKLQQQFTHQYYDMRVYTDYFLIQIGRQWGWVVFRGLVSIMFGALALAGAVGVGAGWVIFVLPGKTLGLRLRRTTYAA